MKGLKLLAAVVELHIEAGQRNIAGVPDREHNLGIVSGADTGIGGRSGRQLRRADQRVGKPRERLPHTGAPASFHSHRIVAGSAVQQRDAVGALRKLHQAEGAADRIRAGVIAHAPHQILRGDSLSGGIRRSRAFRPVQIHTRAESGNVKAVRDDLHVVIRDHRPRGTVYPAFEALGIFALLQLHPLQVEQPVRGRVSIRLSIYAEVGDIPRCQQRTLAIGNAGKLAEPGVVLSAQRIDAYHFFRPLPCCVGQAHMVAGNAVFVAEGCGVELHKPIQTRFLVVDHLAIDRILAAA